MVFTTYVAIPNPGCQLSSVSGCLNPTAGVLCLCPLATEPASELPGGVWARGLQAKHKAGWQHCACGQFT